MTLPALALNCILKSSTELELHIANGEQVCAARQDG